MSSLSGPGVLSPLDSPLKVGKTSFGVTAGRDLSLRLHLPCQPPDPVSPVHKVGMNPPSPPSPLRLVILDFKTATALKDQWDTLVSGALSSETSLDLVMQINQLKCI